MALAEHPEDVRRLTIKGNTVAVVTDGSAVLGLGDIGPGAAMPVMEGKAALFKRFADIDAWPICLDTQDVDEIVRTVELIAPGFGGINLEDIAAPRCFEIEARLREKLDIPVFHDDQHGTAIVVLAALTQRAAGRGQAAGGREDRRRRWRRRRDGDRAPAAQGRRRDRCWCGTARASSRPTTTGSARPSCDLARRTNPGWRAGRAARRAGRRRRLHRGQRRQRAGRRGPRPDERAGGRLPDGQPDAGGRPGAGPRSTPPIVASGRSDLPNQINNVLAFPGVFRGLLDARATEISDGMLLAAAEALAAVVTRRPAQRQLHHPERLRPRGHHGGGRGGRRPGPARAGRDGRGPAASRPRRPDGRPLRGVSPAGGVLQDPRSGWNTPGVPLLAPKVP